MMTNKNKNWFYETHQEQQSFGLKIEQVLYHKQSKYQEILVFENKHFGRVLVLDGAYMLSDLDEFMYHKAITRYGMQNLEPGLGELKVLLIGGGDGGVARDLLQHWHDRIEQITMVEIDQDVVDVARKFFPDIASALDHPKLKLCIQDALQFINTAPKQEYDLVICDSTDPEGFAAGLIEEDFYISIKSLLKQHGVFVAQSGSPYFMKQELGQARENLGKVFAQVQTFYAPMLVYPGSVWSYTLASDRIINTANLDIAEFVNNA